jgi:mannose-1-phosphate guanylyltransferase
MTWTIVLAGGTGDRLAEETRRRFGYQRPKQFCDFDGTGTLLDKALLRAGRVSDVRRTLVVTTRDHRRDADEILQRHPGVRKVEQARSRDTTPGIALPILHVYARDPDDLVLLLPSDHFIVDEDRCASTIGRALDRARSHPDRVVILGAEPGDTGEERGWIVPSGDGFGVSRVLDCPTPAEIGPLRAGGALINTSILAARARTLARVIARQVPGWWRALLEAFPDKGRLEAAFDVLPPSEFVADVLQRVSERLDVLRLDSAIGWSDLSTPANMARVLSPERREPPKSVPTENVPRHSRNRTTLS